MAVVQQSYFSLVVADGAPYVQEEPAPLTADARTDASEEQHAARRLRVDQAVAAARGRTPETDLLGAIGLAERSIHEQPGLHSILVLDSGLSTTGALDFTRPALLDADPRELADTLADSRQLPHLEGVLVVVQGLGDTTAPQQPLDPARRSQLTAIWAAILKKSGARSVEFEQSPPQDAVPPSLPPVRPVRLPLEYTCTPGTVTLSGGRVAFVPDTDQFIDPTGARDVLRPIAQQMSAQSLKADLFGTSPSVGDPEARRKLSELRAQAVANLLIGMGIPLSRLRVEGKGSDFPGLAADHDAAGHLIPTAAAMNRKVVLEVTGPVSCG